MNRITGVVVALAILAGVYAAGKASSDAGKPTAAQRAADSARVVLEAEHSRQTTALAALQAKVPQIEAQAARAVTAAKQQIMKTTAQLDSMQDAANARLRTAVSAADSAAAAETAMIPVAEAKALVRDQWLADSLALASKDSVIAVRTAAFTEQEGLTHTAEGLAASWKVKYNEETQKQRSMWVPIVAGAKTTGKILAVVGVVALVVQVAK